METSSQNRLDPSLISYITLRRAVGILGIALPVVLVTGSCIFGHCREIQSSISAYYYTMMRNIFVGIISAIALFLFAYKGYERIDAIAGNLACVFALGVAFFPTSISEPLTYCIPKPVDTHWISTVHFASAAGFFSVLSFFSIFLFTKSVKNPSKMKLKRNALYRICGYVILGCMIIIAIYSVCENHGNCQTLQKLDPVFWFEALALWAFGISWLTKGKTILSDKPDY